MLGRFVNGVGTFYNDETLRGKPIKVRFIWSKITRNFAIGTGLLSRRRHHPGDQLDQRFCADWSGSANGRVTKRRLRLRALKHILKRAFALASIRVPITAAALAKTRLVSWT
ncbi:hypothetical protein [Phenylobacterium sp.]|uniref:hypothetical protein n=1 Tax=Phenylobacterium sp. TaxID=1871053 RepID=UPI001227B24C|nr:hypothetical protein [Phenylobacterium sp.]THD60816.1 MAG: hypothetical protein E8A49_12595 [Phenylobacterium sp.]